MQDGRTSAETADATGSKAVERVAAIVMTLAEEARPMGIAEVSEAASLPQATVHRLLNALVAPGWVEKEPSTGRYRLGHGLLGPAVATLSPSPPLENPQAIVKRAHASASGKVLLAFMDPDSRRRLYRGQRQLRQFTPKTVPDVEALEAQLVN